MRKKVEEYIRTAAEVYCLLLFVILPLYMRYGFVMLGDIKYQFFRNVTVLFFLLLSALLIVRSVSMRGEKGAQSFKSAAALRCRDLQETKGAVILRGAVFSRTFSWTDIFVLGYLMASVLSFCFAVDHSTAFWGFSEWHMGLLSQIMFIWIYFIFSRWHGKPQAALWACFGCVLVVMTLAVLNRYGYDPLGVFRWMEQGMWEREHMLSTVGNQNWYCSYISVAAAVCFCFGYLGRGAVRTAGLLGCLVTFLTVMTQGSESGYLIPLVLMAALFADALSSRRKCLRFCIIALCCPAAALLGMQGIRLRGLMLVEDGSLRGILLWEGWLTLLFLLCVISAVLYIREKKERTDYLRSGKIRKVVLTAAVILLVMGIIVFILCQFSEVVWIALGEEPLLRITDSWGNGRGALWQMSWAHYMESPWYRKLFGVGPDCFSHFLYASYTVNGINYAVEQWGTNVFANAHNEWLNMLINQGILGLIFYAGIFGTSFVRLWKIRGEKEEACWGILAVACYCIHNTVSFQQAVSTPLIFAVMGISEALMRSESGQEGSLPQGEDII